MVKRERVADNVYFFQSSNYAQVNAGVIAGPDMAIVIDTLAFPEESMKIRSFIDDFLQVPVRYLINTHYHADHCWGNMFFPEAKIISHALCYEKLKAEGTESLNRAKKESKIFKDIEIVLPDITFEEGELGLKVGKKHIRIFHFPGHSDDCIALYIEEDKVLFSSDTLMTIPYIVDGDIEVTKKSLLSIKSIGIENIVQGHGDIILRGEVDNILENNVEYLNCLEKIIKKANRRKYPLDILEENGVETCGKSKVEMGGLVNQLHENNLIALYKKVYGETPIGSEVYFE